MDARGCLHTVDALSDEAVIEARSRLNPAAGVMLSALWVASERQLVVIAHHLAVDGVSWRIVLEDINIAWAQHCAGQQVALPTNGTSFQRWASLLAQHARRPEVVEQEQVWRHIAATPAVLPAVRPEVDTYSSAGQLSASLDTETTQMLLGEVPTAFHTGIHDILLIAFALACTSFWAPAPGRSASMWRATGATKSARRYRPVAHRGLVHHQISSGPGSRWAVLGAGRRRRCRVGDGDQSRQRAASGSTGSVDLRGAAISEPRRRPDRVRPGDRVQLSGPARWVRPRHPAMGGGSAKKGGPVAGVAAAIPMPLMHTLKLNAGTVDTDTGPQLQAGWMWAPSALDHARSAG